MSARISEATNEPDKYASMVLHYSHNAQVYLKEGDFHKASEMIWGSMSCVLKAVAAKKNKPITSHRQIGKFAIKLAKEQKNKQIFYSYALASMLHQNFYESDLDEYLVRALSEDISETIGKLMLQMGYRAP